MKGPVPLSKLSFNALRVYVTMLLLRGSSREFTASADTVRYYLGLGSSTTVAARRELIGLGLVAQTGTRTWRIGPARLLVPPRLEISRGRSQVAFPAPGRQARKADAFQRAHCLPGSRTAG